MVAPVNLMLFGPPMTGYDLTIWIVEEVVENLPIWQEAWNVLQTSKESSEANEDANYPPSVVIFTPASTANNLSPTALVYCFQQSSESLTCQTYDGNTWSSSTSIATTSSAAGSTVFNDKLWVFFRGDSNTLCSVTTTDGVTWSTSENVLGSATDVLQNNPTAAVFNGSMYVFYQGAGSNSGTLCYASTADGTTWSSSAVVPELGMQGWTSPSMAMSTSPNAVTFAPSSSVVPFGVWQSDNGSSWSLNSKLSSPAIEGNLYVFFQGEANNGQLCYNIMDPEGHWLGIGQVPRVSMQGEPTAFVYNNQLFVAYDAGGAGGALLYTCSSDGITWCDPILVCTIALSNAPAVTVLNSQINGSQADTNQTLCVMMGPGQDQALWCAGTGTSGGWGAMYSITTGIAVASDTSPGTVTFNNQLYCFFQGTTADSYNANGTLYFTTYTGESAWSSPFQITGGQSSGTVMSCSPAPVVFNDNLYVFFQGGGNNGSMAYVQSSDGSNWSSITSVPNTGMSYTPSPVVFNGQLYIFHTASSQKGEIWFNSLSSSGTWAGDTQIESSLGFYNAPSPPVAVVYNSALYIFYVGKDWQLYYIKCTGGSPSADNWGTPIVVPNSIVNCQDLNGQTCQFFTVVVDETQLSVYFQGIGNNHDFNSTAYCNGFLYCVSTTDPDGVGAGNIGSGWSPTTQIGVTPASASPPSRLADVANMAVAVIAQCPLGSDHPVWYYTSS